MYSQVSIFLCSQVSLFLSWKLNCWGHFLSESDHTLMVIELVLKYDHLSHSVLF